MARLDSTGQRGKINGAKVIESDADWRQRDSKRKAEKTESNHRQAYTCNFAFILSK